MHRSRTGRPTALALLFLVGSAYHLFSAPPATGQPVRLSAPVFGTTAEVEIRDIRRDQADVLARAALAQIFELSQLFETGSTQPGSLGTLNTGAGEGPQALDPRTYDLVLRGSQFCLWSNGAFGPLGSPLRRFWQDRERHGLEDPEIFSLALAASDCRHLRLRSEPTPAAELDIGSRVDGWGIREGLSIDLAMDHLAESGVKNAWIEIGPVARGMGAGPDGDGWPVTLAQPAILGEQPNPDEPIARVLLVDQALAAAQHSGRGASPYIDQRSGRPAEGIVAIFALTKEAVNAQALATTLFVTGHRDGQRRLGSLSPRPAVLWLLGEGTGQPLEATYRWSEVKQFEPK